MSCDYSIVKHLEKSLLQKFKSTPGLQFVGTLYIALDFIAEIHHYRVLL